MKAQKVKAQKEEMVMEEKELRMVLDSHRRWLDGEIGGEKASLGGADLGGMELVGLNLLGGQLGGGQLE